MALTRSTLYMLLSTIAFILVFSAISTYVPPGSSWFWLISILYILIFMTFATIIPRLTTKRKAMEIKGSVVAKASSEEILNLMSRDMELGKELSRQSMFMILMLIVPLLMWFIFAGMIQSYLLQPFMTNSEHYMRFLGYVIFYSLLIGIIRGVTYFTTPKKLIMLVNSYEIRSDGIKAGNLVIKFPIDERRYSVEINAHRGFFEIYDKTTRYAYRFYISDVDKVRIALGKYGKIR